MSDDFPFGGSVEAMIAFDGGAGPTLYVGGDFSKAGGTSVGNLAAWRGCATSAEPCPADITGDGLVDIADLLVMLAAWGECP